VSALALGVLLALFALPASPATAAPCAGDLTIVGQKVTGDDCVTGGDGSITITNPKFGTSGAVNVSGVGDAVPGKMILNAAKTEMVPEAVAIPLQLKVGTTPVMFGGLKVGNFELCDVDAAVAEPAPSLSDVPPNPDAKPIQPKDAAGKVAGSVFQPLGVGCRTIPAFKLDFTNLNDLGKLAGLDVGKFTGALPTTAGFDDEKGGRLFTTVPFKLPKALDQEVNDGGAKKKVPTYIGIGIEVSATEGFKPTSTGFRLNKSIPFGSALSLDQLSGVFDPGNGRFGGGFLLRLPGNKALGANLTLDNGNITKLGGDVTLPAPIPLVGPVSATAIGGQFTAASTEKGPGGVERTTPQTIQGRMKFIVGPTLGGSNTPLQGDTSLTIAGPTLTLKGNLFTVFGTKQVKLADARILVGTMPGRFEAETNLNVFEVIQAHAFLGIVAKHFTALGEARIVIPKDIKFIGGQTLGGFQLAVSEVGAGAVITVDLPLAKPFNVGVGTTFSPFKLKKITSIQSFITVTPTASKVQPARRGAGEAPVLAAAQRKVKLPKKLDQVLVSVVGAKRVPRGVKLTVNGKKVKAEQAGSGENSTEFVLIKPPAGELKVATRDKLARIVVSRLKDFPYLDPSAGFGSQPRGPVTAGQPARVCWKIKNAPKGAVVDLFEDQNGNLGTGSQIAEGRPATGCFDVPTTGLEPGKHWVYGTVRVGSTPVSQRYWPIPITIVDPAAPPAPANVSVTATPDGAGVSWDAVDGAAGYVVRAEPVDDQRGEAIEQDVAGIDTVASLSLRGAKDWTISVQAIKPDGSRGNLSEPIAVTPTDGVVLAGKPGGAAQVAKQWAFQIETVPGVAVKLVSGPPGMTFDAASGQLRWKPGKQAGTATPQKFVVEGCKADRCVQREFNVSAYAKGFAPAGPARGFAITPNVVKSGQVVTLRAQGIDGTPVVKIDGVVVKGVKRLNAGALEFKAPRLAKGAHDVSLKIGGDAEERRPGGLIVQ
jgi:hypothetical protein